MKGSVSMLIRCGGSGGTGCSLVTSTKDHHRPNRHHHSVVGSWVALGVLHLADSHTERYCVVGCYCGCMW